MSQFFRYFSFVLITLILVQCKSNENKNELLTSSAQNDNYIDGIYDIPELHIIPSPNQNKKIQFGKSDKIISFETSPSGKTVAILSEKNKVFNVSLWDLENNKITENYNLPNDFEAYTIAWQPFAEALFILGKEEKVYKIFRLHKKNHLNT